MVKVKICGITNLEDAEAAIKAGCAALGFVFYRKSPRYIKPKVAAKIIKCLPKKIVKIGVFVNAKEQYIKSTAKLCRLDMLQFHGNESRNFCGKFKCHRIIKAFRMKNKSVLLDAKEYKTFAHLFDAFVNSKMGGTGKSFSWELLRQREGFKGPIFLSGGLSARNVRRAIKIARPDWVDVSTCVELKPGKKDHQKVRSLIQAVKNS